MKLNWFPNFYLWKTSLLLDGRILNTFFKCSCQYAISNFHSYSFMLQWCHHPSMMSHFWKVYWESSNIFFHVIHCDVIILQWCHILESLFRNLQTYSLHSFMYCDVIILQWCHILESLFRIFKHILSCIVMSSSFNDVTYWNVRLVSVDTSSVLLQYTHTWQSLLSWIFATYYLFFKIMLHLKNMVGFNLYLFIL